MTDGCSTCILAVENTPFVYTNDVIIQNDVIADVGEVLG